MIKYLERPIFEHDLPVMYYRHEGRVLTAPHWHQEIELIYVQEGILNLGVEEHVFTLEKGDIYIVNSGISHYFLSSPGSVRLVVQIDPTFFTHETSASDLVKHLNLIEPYSIHWDQTIREQIYHFIATIGYEIGSKDIAYRFRIQELLYGFYVKTFRNFPLKQSGSDILAPSIKNQDVLDKLNRVYRYIETHYDHDISLERVSDHIGYNSYYFTRFFKKHTGQTFVEFLNEFRVNRAKWYLVTTDWSISEVAFESGFQSVKTFHSVFRKHVMDSPLQYRKIIQDRVEESAIKRSEL